MSTPNPFEQWLNGGKVNALFSAIAVVVLLSFWDRTRPYAVPIGVVIMAMWFYKWQRKGGKI